MDVVPPSAWVSQWWGQGRTGLVSILRGWVVSSLRFCQQVGLVVEEVAWEADAGALVVFLACLVVASTDK